jgi:hypothetical protein
MFFFDLTHPGQNFRGRSGQAFFSALTPGSHILKHMGPSNRMLRVWFLGCQRNCRWVCLKWDIHGYYMIYTMTIDNDIQYFTPPSFSQWGKWWCIEIGDTPLTQSHGVSYGWQEDSCKVVKLGIYQLEVLTIRFITKCTAVAHLDETNPNYCGQMSTHISLGLIL